MPDTLFKLDFGVILKKTLLPFEESLEEIESRIEQLNLMKDDSYLDVSGQIDKLKKNKTSLLKKIYQSLSPFQISLVARHKDRPTFLSYVDCLFSDFSEIHGDGYIADDLSIVGGLARFRGIPCVVIGQQKGVGTKDKIARNFGMPSPEGYRKAKNLFQLAGKFSLPLFTFVDTPGAFPGISAEEHNQSEAIGRNLSILSTLETPIISIIIGEGGSGGALALAMADEVCMFEYSVYSVISPEGCSSILWKNTTTTEKASEALSITAFKLHELGLIDKIIKEPVGGAHRDFDKAASYLSDALFDSYQTLKNRSKTDLLSLRQTKYLSIGSF